MEGYKQPYYHFCSQRGCPVDIVHCHSAYVHVPYDDHGAESYANEEAHLSKSFGSCKPVCLTAVCKNTTAVEIFSSALESMLRKVLKVCIEVSFLSDTMKMTKLPPPPPSSLPHKVALVTYLA